MAQTIPGGSSWQGSLRDLASIVNTIRRSHAFGRLTLRNTVRLGVAHLYFHGGKLVHAVSNRGDANATLYDLQAWSRALVRFDRGSAASNLKVNDDYDQLLDYVLSQLQMRGIILRPEMPPPQSTNIENYNKPVTRRNIRTEMPPPQSRVIESHLVAEQQAEQLITPWEWQILVESTRRVSLAVARLVGPREAMNVLRDILSDCSAGFPALSGLEIAASGYLHFMRSSQFDHTPRDEILEGFAALFATCQHFCSPIVGEEGAHKLIIQALSDIGPALVSLGVFQVDRELLSRN